MAKRTVKADAKTLAARVRHAQSTRTKQLAHQVAPAHSVRFRTFGDGYPQIVAEAYEGDLYRAMKSTDKQVARMVVKWAKRLDLPLRNWEAAVRVLEGRGR